MRIEVYISGEPVAQGRPRFSTFGGYVKAYDPAKSRDFKNLVRLEAEKAMGGLPPATRAVSVDIEVYRSAPRSFSKKKLKAALERTLRPVTRPDVDNYAKSVLDGMTGVVWADDAQIVHLSVDKYYSGRPHVLAAVESLEDDDAVR